MDADCRAPSTWLDRIARRFDADPRLLALSGNYRFYDWDWWGRSLLRAFLRFTGNFLAEAVRDMASAPGARRSARA